MSERLWAPWRMDYILGPKSDGCVFCEAAEAAPERDRELHVLGRRRHGFALLNRFPYSHGHLMVVPNRHVSTLGDLSAQERFELMELTALCENSLSSALSPHGFNVGINLGKCAGAGIADHLHIHLVPRWEGDSNFMPLLADTRIMPEHLDQTYDKLALLFHP